ncbi:hypothetical protein A6A27_13325 [Micromonospora sp. CB01531]|nr:hypothetical protein A6A27_13325 [Micromonospora sp. CB01531]
MWVQTLDEVSRQQPKYVVFVTADTKDDWYLRVKGKTIIGRPELADECSEKSGARLVVMPTKSFLRYAREHLDADVSAETLQQAAKVAAQPEYAVPKKLLQDMRDNAEARKRELLIQVDMAEDLYQRAYQRLAEVESRFAARAKGKNLPTGDELESMEREIERARANLNRMTTLRQRTRENLDEAEVVLAQTAHAIRSAEEGSNQR